MLRSVHAHLFGTLLLAALGVASCGGDDEGDKFTDEDAQALCREYVDTSCEKIYECLSDAQLADLQFPSSVAACKTQFRESEGCDAFTAAEGNCKGSEVFKKEKADDCIRQTNEASCNQVTSGEEYAPACDQTCKVE